MIDRQRTMGQMKSFAKRTCAFLLVMAMFSVLLPIGMITVSASASETGSKVTTQRTIGILFDNSGSMYTDTAWCRAIYAMEVFASMANEGDTILIYPMHKITVNGVSYTYSSPLIIDGGGDASVIRQIYTPESNGTPIESLESAYADLTKRSGEEKWLVVLTDGDKFHEDGEELSVSETEEKLTALLSSYSGTMNLMYLGIGEDAVLPEVTGSANYVHEEEKAEDSADILSILTEMCNQIYGRDELPDVDTDTSTISFDLSMSKLILFVQGSNIRDLKLTDTSGEEVSTPVVTYTPSYSEMGSGSAKTSTNGYYRNMASDTSLSGAIVTYESIPAGTYTLTYSGTATSVGVYYEPNVKINALLVNREGINVMDLEDEIYTGTYTLQFGLTDEEGNLTDSSLLGDREFTITYSINGEEQTVTAEENGSVDIELAAGDELDVDVKAVYLNGYEASTELDADWGFPITCVEAPFELAATLTGGASSYEIPSFEENAVYYLQAEYNGEMLTDDALDAAEIEVAFSGESTPDYTCELSDDGSKYVICLKYPGEDANALTDGAYIMTATASYSDEYGQTQSVQVQSNFTVEPYSYAIDASMEADNYYTFSQLRQGGCITVDVITEDGNPLTEEQMEQASLTFAVDGDTEDVASVKADEENSRFFIYLNPDTLKAGKHTLSAVVTVYDEIGNEVTSPEITNKTEVQRYPFWVRILVVLLILLLIALLIWLYMNQKVLPKRILVDADTEFTVQHRKIEDVAVVRNYRGGRKTGTITINSPACPFNSEAVCGITLTLEAVDPRRRKSSMRKAKVVRAKVSNEYGVKKVTVGSASYKKAGDVSRYVSEDDPQKDMTLMDEIISNNTDITLEGKVDNPRGGKSGMIFNINLRFQ